MGFTAQQLSTNRLKNLFKETDDVHGVKRAVAIYCLQSKDFLASDDNERKLVVDNAFCESLTLPEKDVTCHKVDLTEWLDFLNKSTKYIPKEKHVPLILRLVHSRFAHVSENEMLAEINTVERIDEASHIKFSEDYPEKNWLKVVRDMSRLAEKTAKAVLESEIKEELIKDPSELIKGFYRNIEYERRPGFVHFEVDGPEEDESFVATVAETDSGKIVLAMTPLFEYLNTDSEKHSERLDQHLEMMSGQLVPDVNSHYRYFRKYGVFSLISTMNDKSCLGQIIVASAFELCETQEVIDKLIDDFEQEES